MTRRLSLIILAALVSAMTYARETAPDIVPEPSQVRMDKGGLRISGAVFKCDPGIDSLSLDAIGRFAARLSLVSGRTSSVSTPVGLSSVVADGSAKGLVFLKDTALSPDEYGISVNRRFALVRAGGREGFLNSVQTLKQMLPPCIYDGKASGGEKWVLPCCEIRDRPKTASRGVRIDSCEEFWSVEQLKEFIEGMAQYKFNRLLWRIADSRGWRMEVHAYPLLAQAGGYRQEEGGRYGGYYTQDEIRSIVRHAESLGISIIPEIRIEGRFVGDGQLRPSDTDAETFLRRILSEAARLFPCGQMSVTDEEWAEPGQILVSLGKTPAGEDTLGFPELKAEKGQTDRLASIAENLWKSEAGKGITGAKN